MPSSHEAAVKPGEPPPLVMISLSSACQPRPNTGTGRTMCGHPPPGLRVGSLPPE